jgi:phage terminase large subunit
MDTVQLSDRVIACIDAEEPDATVVDGDGLGAGVVDQLRHRNYGRTVHEFHGGANAQDCHMYFNKRTECWGWLRDWLQAGAEIPDHAERAVDLCAPGYDTTRGKRFHGSIQLEHKDDLKARGEASPDHGDTLAMTFAVKVVAKQRPKYGPNLIYGYPGQRNQSWMQ